MRYREPRFPCALRVVAQGERGRIFCEIINISRNGARVVAVSGLRRGEVLALELSPGVAPLRAEVRWSRDGMAGLRFAQALSPGAVARLRGVVQGIPPPAWAGHHAGVREMR